MTTENNQITVLIVDDNPDILKLLFIYLKTADFEVRVAESGQDALDTVAHARPDIILMDVLMPGMNGFEACRRLKANEETKDIPVIFLTALTDTTNKIEGFQSGAVDYITKPSQSEEVVARVKTHLTIRNLQRNMEEQNQRLKDENLKRRRVQDALRESRERYRLLAENSTDMISKQTPKGVYQYVSPACMSLLGYKIEELVGRKEVDFVHPDDVHIIENAITNVEERPLFAKYQVRARRKSGDYIWVETTNKLTRDPKSQIPLEITAVSRNVTERKEAEDALQEAHDKLELRVLERTAELVQLNTALERFVPHEFLQFLGKKSIVDVSLGDQVQREMTIFCSDIRSFSSMSEKMTPQENFNFLNRYLRRVSPVIRQHNGFVDKYIGDAVMALFPDQAEHALQAAIAIRKELMHFNREREKRGAPLINIGTGIHTGGLMLGTIGEQERMESTVISDSVNMAFRLENLTKLYGAAIIISQYSLFSLAKPSKYHFRFLDRVLVKGKQEPVSVFEVFEGDPPALIELKQKTLTSFEKGMLHYHSQEFAEAKSHFKEVLDTNPNDMAAQLYLKRAEHFALYGVPLDWEGVAALSEK